MKMKFLVVLCVVIGASLADDTSFYTTADDNMDMESLIKDPVRAKSYLDCFLGKKPCGTIAASYLRIIPDSIQKGCSRCNPAQKHLANVFLHGLRSLMPEKYEEFTKKFDPKGIYMDNFLQKVKGF